MKALWPRRTVYRGEWVYGADLVMEGDNGERERRKLCASERLIEMIELRVKMVFDRAIDRRRTRPELQEGLDAGRAQ